MNRRFALKNLGGLALLPVLKPQPVTLAKHRSLRIAHLTDIHLKNDLGAPPKFAKCLHHVQQLMPKVDLILNGGDTVFDMNKKDLGTINDQWNLYQGMLKNECSLPVKYCLGNHDIWWNEDTKGDIFYGKHYSLDKLHMPKPYYSFTQKNWKFIVLDSTHLDIDNTWYIGKLDDTQFSWLETEFRNTPKDTPILVMSHIPILTATNLIDDKVVNKWVMYGGDMHTDTSKIIKLFYQYPNIRLCLSGHIHLREKLVYNNVTYLCNGAVSGAWWEGQVRETPPGYGIIDLYDDGSFDESYVPYA